jgi:glycine/D-amino acid oxidase-like deaminating enzyme
LQVSGVKGAKSCLTYDAARVWPYKLVTHMLELVVARGVNLQTNTPVTSITPDHTHSESQSWTINTTRGSIKSNTVIHATNGYTSALVPELLGKIVPVKGMVARLVPTTERPELAESYMMRFSEYEYDYLIPRPDGSIVVGGARRDFYKELDSWFNVFDDGSLIKGAENYFEGYMQRHFLGWEICSIQTENLWTGSEFHTPLLPALIVENVLTANLLQVMGYSDDGFPYVGTVPDKEGQFICAGFSGHGMPQIFLSAKAIAEMVTLGSTAEEAGLPLPYWTTERWSRHKEHVSSQAWRAVVERQTVSAKL